MTPAGGGQLTPSYGGKKMAKMYKMYRGTPEDDEELERERRDHGKWKSYFMKYHRTKRNWDTGKYSLATLTHHKNTVRCVQFDENYNMITARYMRSVTTSVFLPPLTLWPVRAQ
jgi:hypothetical protein